MSELIRVTVMETLGDEDEGHEYLWADKEGVGNPALGEGTLTATMTPSGVQGLSFLIIGSTVGGHPVRIQEEEGDEDTTHIKLVLPKEMLGLQHAHDSIDAFVVPTESGRVIVVPFKPE